MALFKILRGNCADLDSTPFHDGYAYLTVDDGGFYIDALSGNDQKRIQINEKTTTVDSTLTAAGWVDNQQVLLVDDLTADQNGIIGLPQDISDTEKTAANWAILRVCGQDVGALTIAADGKTPACDIPVVITLFN